MYGADRAVIEQIRSRRKAGKHPALCTARIWLSENKTAVTALQAFGNGAIPSCRDPRHTKIIHYSFFTIHSSLNIFPYHSISSTGVGCGLTVMSRTFAFFIRMTRSAMGVIAWLWVMSTTVICWVRQVSCRSLRIFLPVL